MFRVSCRPSGLHPPADLKVCTTCDQRANQITGCGHRVGQSRWCSWRCRRLSDWRRVRSTGTRF